MRGAIGNMDNNSMHPPLAALIRSRRTVRHFDTRPVPVGLIAELLDIAVWAPTHGNRQPWRFILFTEQGRRLFAQAVVATFHTTEQKQHIPAKLDYYEKLPAHLVIVMPEDPRSKQWEEDFAAASCLIQNFQLAAWERGLGVVWKTNTFIYEPSFRQQVGVRPGEKIVGVLHIGYPKIIPPALKRVPAEQMLTIINGE